MDDYGVLLGVVAVFSVVHSLFGVGLLVFGTPTLLALGFPFEVAVANLLPPSFAISALQSFQGRRHVGRLGARILAWCVPGIVLGMFLVVGRHWVVDVKGVVAAALLFSAAARFSKRIEAWLGSLLERVTPLYLAGMGFVHGLSNMGGGFLTIYVGTLYREKDAIRANIAFGYLIFVAAQLAVLGWLRPDVFDLGTLAASALALGVYLSVGQFLYLRSSRALYQHAITVLMASYGIVLLAQAVG